MFRKPHLKLLRWYSLRGTNNKTVSHKLTMPGIFFLFSCYPTVINTVMYFSLSNVVTWPTKLYGVIKNMIMQIMINLPQILIWPMRPQKVSVPNLKLFGSIKTELLAKEVGESSIMLYGKMGWGHSVAYQHGCRNINVWRSSKLWTTLEFINLKLAEIFQNGVIYIM